MKKKLDLILKEEADLEVIEAYLYYEKELEGLGERFLTELDRVILAINLTPNGFQNFHNSTRQIPFDVFPYVMVYEVIGKSLIIYAVFQTQQDPKGKVR